MDGLFSGLDLERKGEDAFDVVEIMRRVVAGHLLLDHFLGLGDYDLHV